MKGYYGVIYSATNTINDKKYIGQTIRGLKKRKNEHIWLAKNGSDWAFQQAIRKYGEDAFEWDIIDRAKNQEELNDKEIYWIELCNTFYEGGYNMAIGGQYNLGGTDDEISLSRGGRAFLIYDLKGQFVKETISQKAFAEEINVYPQTVNNVLLGIKNQAKGFIMIFKDVFSEDLLHDRLMNAINSTRERNIYVFNRNDLSFIGVWDNRVKCQKDLKISRRTITDRLNDSRNKHMRTPYYFYCEHGLPEELRFKIKGVI